MQRGSEAGDSKSLSRRGRQRQVSISQPGSQALLCLCCYLLRNSRHPCNFQKPLGMDAEIRLPMQIIKGVVASKQALCIDYAEGLLSGSH